MPKVTWSGYKMVWSDGEAGSESPAGWTKTDELVDDLVINGYIPVSGKVYSADTTINGNMYPAEISAGGETAEKPIGVKLVFSSGEDWIDKYSGTYYIDTTSDVLILKDPDTNETLRPTE
jgi:hypothetical protein